RAWKSLGRTSSSRIHCMVSHLTEHLCSLPAEVVDNVDQLESLMMPLENFFDEDASAGELLDSLSEIHDQIDLPDTDDFENQLETGRTDLGQIVADAPVFIADIDTFITALDNFKTPLSTLQTKLDTYLDTLTTQGTSS
ncbi:MAG: hypothetical protein MI802_24530, partial [Desulfobacterales bacterium]|nr:hypothetical protein [Desulfobacterales bacterium]